MDTNQTQIRTRKGRQLNPTRTPKAKRQPKQKQKPVEEAIITIMVPPRVATDLIDRGCEGSVFEKIRTAPGKDKTVMLTRSELAHLRDEVANFVEYSQPTSSQSLYAAYKRFLSKIDSTVKDSIQVAA